MAETEETVPEGEWEKPVPHDEAYPAYSERPDREAYAPETVKVLKAHGLL